MLCLCCLLGCAAPERHVSTNGKPSSIKLTGETHLISKKDVQEIIAVVQKIPDIDHNILIIRVVSADKVIVDTGIVRGPLDGGGDIVIIQREKDGWKWDEDRSMSWVS